MTKQYTPESAASALADGEATLDQIREATGWPIMEGCLVPEPSTWHADDGNAEVTGEYVSGEEAAQDYADTGDWGDADSTIWVSVHVWLEGIDEDGDTVRVAKDHHKIAIDPAEPDCPMGDHDWQSPYEILEGCEDNPGVLGSGGGVVSTEVCMHCGCARVTDSWAQDPDDGQQGLTSVTYEPGKYEDEVRDFRLADLPAIAEEEDEYSTDRLVHDAENDDEYRVLHLNGGESGAHQRGGNFFPRFLAWSDRLSSREAADWLVERGKYETPEEAREALP